MFDELRRRNVHRTALAYLAGSWLLVQVVETLTPDFLPASVFRITVMLLAIGFLPALVLAWKFEWTPDGLRREETIRTDSERPHSASFDRAVTAVLVLVVAFFAVDKFVFDPARDEAEMLAATEEATKRALSGTFLDEFRGRSILVLPFLNLSTDAEQEFFADGISEEILNILARIEELRVISRSTSWTFKGKDIDVGEIHRELDVSHMLEGSVRKAGDQVRVTAQLIDAGTDTHLWSETYDRSLDDVFAIQDDIAVAVADRLHLEILSADSPHQGVDPRAYQLYLRGSVQREDSPSRAALMDMNRLLREALAIEPNYVPALYDLAATHEFMAQTDSDSAEFAEHREAVTSIVDRMEELAPDSIFVSNWRAYMAMRWEADLIAAAPYLETSMRFANRTDVHIWFNGAVDQLNMLGRHNEAMTVAQYWVNRDPYCANCLRQLVRSAIAAGRRDEAALVLDELSSRADSAVDYWRIGVAYLAAGRPEKALQHFEQIDDDSPDIDREFARALALHSLGRTQEFETVLRRNESDYPESSAEGIARLYAWSGQADEAFFWLEKMVEDQGPESAILVMTELYDPIKPDPRWTDFLERNGAADETSANVRFDPQYPPTLQRAVDSLSSRP